MKEKANAQSSKETAQVEHDDLKIYNMMDEKFETEDLEHTVVKKQNKFNARTWILIMDLKLKVYLLRLRQQLSLQDPDSEVDYMYFANDFIIECEDFSSS